MRVEANISPAGGGDDDGVPVPAPDDCGITRQQCIECAAKYCDINQDGVIDAEEIAAIKSKWLTFYEKFFAWALDQTPERMLFLCGTELAHDDLAPLISTVKKNLSGEKAERAERRLKTILANNERVITHRSFVEATDTCLYECVKRDLFWNKICLPAAAEEHEQVLLRRQEQLQRLSAQIDKLEE